MGKSRRLFPTAARIAAPDLGLAKARRSGPRPATRLRGRNGSFNALLELMLYKTPSAPQRCANCAEVRSPLTALAMAGKLSPALSLHPNAQVRPAQLGCCALCSRLPVLLSPFPGCGLQAPQDLRSSVAPQTLSNSPQTPSSGRSARPYIGPVRRDLASAL